MILNYIIIVALLLLSALFSGLTLGLMSLDPFELHRKMKLGNKSAKKIYPLRNQGNLLLTTLLVGNVAVNSALAVFLGSITQGLIAGLISTGLIVIFGEILPQSLFSRYALKLGAKSVPIVYLFLYLLYPVTKPIAMTLDKMLGHELPTAYSKKELKLLVEEQHSLKESDLEKHEYAIVKGGLVFSKRKVKSVMTCRKETYFISPRQKLTQVKLKEIQSKGHSRIPVYDSAKHKIVGVLYTKDLIVVDYHDNTLVKNVMRKDISIIKENSKLDHVLDLFKKKRKHLFVVHNSKSLFTGIITLEDVLEEIVGEITDEHDKVVDLHMAGRT